MKSCTACEADIPDDVCICEYCEEVIQASISVSAEVKSKQEPAEVSISSSEVESGFETVPGDVPASSEVGSEFKIEQVDILGIVDVEAEIDTVQVHISGALDIEVEIDTVQVDISGALDIEAGIDTVQVDSSKLSDIETYLEGGPISSSLSSDNIDYEGEERKFSEDAEEIAIREGSEDASPVVPVMYCDDLSDKGLQQRKFTVPAPLYSDSGLMMAQSEITLSASMPDDEDGGEEMEREREDVLSPVELSTFVLPTLFYSGVQPSIQPTADIYFEKAPLQASFSRSRFSIAHALIILLICLIVITSSGISILFVRSHSHAMTPQIVPVAQLKVKPGSLNFGQVVAGTKVILAVVVANTGHRVMNWYVDTGNLAWLKVGTPAGNIQPGGPEQFIYTTADTSQLKVGNYLGDEDIHSNGGYTRIPIQMEVVSSTGKKEAKLNVDQTGIDLGSALPGQLVSSSVTVGNVGNQSLSWQASVGDTSWLSLDTASPIGTVPAGGFPQTFNITANTTNLALGSYSAMLNIQSNGGNAHIGIFLVVSANPITVPPTLMPAAAPTLVPSTRRVSAPPTQAPTMTATQTPTVTPSSPSSPAWLVTPNSVDSTCLTTECVVTLSEDTAATGSMTWSASSDVGASFSPSNGTLAPGSSQQVIITGMACNNGTFTFSGTGGATPLTVNWICSPTAAPTTPPTVIAPTAPVPTVAPTPTVAPIAPAPTPTVAPVPTVIPTAAIAPTVVPTSMPLPTMVPTVVVTPTSVVSPTMTPTAVLYARSTSLVGGFY